MKSLIIGGILFVSFAFTSTQNFTPGPWGNCGTYRVGDAEINLVRPRPHPCADQNYVFSEWKFDTLKSNTLLVSLGSCIPPGNLFCAAQGYNYQWSLDNTTNTITISNDTASYSYFIVSETPTTLQLKRK